MKMYYYEPIPGVREYWMIISIREQNKVLFMSSEIYQQRMFSWQFVGLDESDFRLNLKNTTKATPRNCHFFIQHLFAAQEIRPYVEEEGQFFE